MKYLNGEYYVEVKDHRYKTHPAENIFLRKRDYTVIRIREDFKDIDNQYQNDKSDHINF